MNNKWYDGKFSCVVWLDPFTDFLNSWFAEGSLTYIVNDKSKTITKIVTGDSKEAAKENLKKWISAWRGYHRLRDNPDHKKMIKEAREEFIV